MSDRRRSSPPSPTGSALGSALDSALGALARRDVSGVELERKLAEKGFDNADREDALAILRRTGLVDDDRYATARASALASRGAGDALIRHDLERAGLAPETIEAAFAELESEAVRARRIVDRRGDGPRTRRYLAGKGFSDDAIDVAVGGSSCW